MLLEVGQVAPTIQLPDDSMNPIDSADFLGEKNIVLYFYPKDDTPGCTIEAQDFSDLLPEFEALQTKVFGISRDTCASHGEFRDKYGLAVDLVADVDGVACNAFGVWQLREKNGEQKEGLVRSTFIIDKAGVIQHAMYNVKPKNHARDVLDMVKAL